MGCKLGDHGPCLFGGHQQRRAIGKPHGLALTARADAHGIAVDRGIEHGPERGAVVARWKRGSDEAFALDRHWNVVASNSALPALYEGCAEALLAAPLNVLRLSLHPEGIAPRKLAGVLAAAWLRTAGTVSAHLRKSDPTIPYITQLPTAIKYLAL